MNEIKKPVRYSGVGQIVDADGQLVALIARWSSRPTKTTDAVAAEIVDALNHNPDDGWVAVADRLPDPDANGCEIVHVTFELDGMLHVSTVRFEEGKGFQMQDADLGKNTPVIAWLPTPEPYKPIDKAMEDKDE